MAASPWAHLGYLSACEAALQAYGVETAATEADAERVRQGSIEALVLGRRGSIEPLDLGWTEEYGWGYSRKVYSDRADPAHTADPAYAAVDEQGAAGRLGAFGDRGADQPEAYTHGQFGGGVLPDPEHFADLVVRIAAGEELEDHLPGEPLAYRAAGDADGFTDRLLAFEAGRAGTATPS